MNLWPLLTPFSLIYGAAVLLRNLAYDIGIKKSSGSRARIISVGNLSAGGSGKTPCTISLADISRRKLPEANIVVVSRGYKRKSRGSLVVSDGKNISLDVNEAGDEPMLIAQSLLESPSEGKSDETLKGVPVIVAEKRIQGVKLAEDLFDANLVLLDDAFQHRALKRDIDIVLLDESVPAWHWRLLPAGRLREPAASLKRANIIVLTGNGDSQRKAEMKEWINKYNPSVPVFDGTLQADYLTELVKPGDKLSDESKSVHLEIDSLKDRKVAAYCGIARPERFFDGLKNLGADVVIEQSSPDHFSPDQNMVNDLLRKVEKSPAEVLVITSKDAVKWTFSIDSSVPIWVFHAGIYWGQNRESIEKIIEGILEPNFS